MKAPPPLAERQKPGLSITLPGPRDVSRCQSCGFTATDPALQLQRWIECDEWDRHDAKSRVVILCERCSKRFINPHPRLYVQLWANDPRPGLMPICSGCVHQDHLECSHEDAKANGGAGLALEFDKPPVRAHLNYGGGRGEWKVMYGGVTRCAGREVVL